MSATAISGGAICWTRTKVKAGHGACCLLVKLCDPYLSSKNWGACYKAQYKYMTAILSLPSNVVFNYSPDVNVLLTEETGSKLVIVAAVWGPIVSELMSLNELGGVCVCVCVCECYEDGLMHLCREIISIEIVFGEAPSLGWRCKAVCLIQEHVR